MKKVIFLLAFLAAANVAVKAQFTFGLKLGLSTPDVKPADFPNPLKLKTTGDSLLVKLSDANYGFHGGIWVRARMGRFFIQPEVVFNTSTVEYNFKKGNGMALTDSLRTEKFNNIDVPLLLGFKFGTFRLNGGPVAHFRLDNQSAVDAFKNFTSTFKNAAYGYQAGIGLDFGSLGIDLRYEGNFDNFKFGGNEYQGSTSPSRLLVSLGYAF